MSYCQARVIAKPILPLMDISKSMGTIKGNYVFLKAENGLILRGGGRRHNNERDAACSSYLTSELGGYVYSILIFIKPFLNNI